MKFEKTKIIIAIILIVVIIGAIIFYLKNRKENSNSSNNTTKSQEINKDSNEESDTYKIGETAIIDGVKVTINKVENYTDATQKPKDGNKFIKVDIQIENTNNADRGIISSDFKCLVGTKQATIVNINSQDRLKSSTLVSNKTVTGSIYYEVDSSANNYEIDYEYDDLSDMVLKFLI